MYMAENQDYIDCSELESKFNDLLSKAREIYPNIDESIVSFNGVCKDMNDLIEYQNLQANSSFETTSNQAT